MEGQARKESNSTTRRRVSCTVADVPAVSLAEVAAAESRGERH